MPHKIIIEDILDEMIDNMCYIQLKNYIKRLKED